MPNAPIKGRSRGILPRTRRSSWTIFRTCWISASIKPPPEGFAVDADLVCGATAIPLLDIEVFHGLGSSLDKALARRHFVAHQHRKDLVGPLSIVNSNLE